MKDCIGGVILYDETIRQKTSFEKNVPELIRSSGSITGIKVDTGAKMLAGSNEEKITEGLDGLRERLKDYYKLGARFTKWRGVYTISDKYPSNLSISANANALARYAALVQESGMVPIIEPEVLMEGDHSAKTCFNKTSEVLKKCYEELELNKVDLKGTILKPNMVLAGQSSISQLSHDEVADLTMKCLKENVPAELPGIAFLSGGQSDLDATANLDALNKKGGNPWKLTFSYGRALQQAALKAWMGDKANTQSAQDAFSHRAEMNKLAALGQWDKRLEG
jgi:fructose-bisphosphate aldolase class I